MNIISMLYVQTANIASVDKPVTISLTDCGSQGTQSGFSKLALLWITAFPAVIWENPRASDSCCFNRKCNQQFLRQHL